VAADGAVRAATSATATAAVLMALVVVLAACGGSETTPASQKSPTVLRDGRQKLAAGTHVFDLVGRRDDQASGLAHLPRIAITLPGGWFNYDGWAVGNRRGGGDVFVTFWDVDRVYPTPCDWKYRAMLNPGRSVPGLAAALRKQPLRDATAPVDVVLAGVRGKYLEWSVPDDIRFADCDEGVFESWTGRGWASDRYQQAPGQVDRLWILDVEGERLVVDASYMPTATPEERAILQGVVSSIRFLD
jgi:hypothetical protein